MRNVEGSIPNPEAVSTVKKESEQEKRARLISRYIETQIIEKHESTEVEEKEIQISLEDISSEEKAVRIYENLIATVLAKQSAKKDGESLPALDSYLVSEIKMLWKDEKTQQIFLAKYAKARIELKNFRLSDITQRWEDIEDDITRLTERSTQLQQDLNLKRVSSPDAIKATKSKLFNTQKTLKRLQADREKIVQLKEYEHIPENTDVAALIMYETLKRYHEEAKANFVWLPSRKGLHKKIIDTIEHTGKAPLLVGPPGTGKTTQLDAVALEMTGKKALPIPCGSGLGEEGIVANRDMKAGEGSYDYKGCIAEAATGYLHSQDENPTYKSGRWVVLDEISELNIPKALAPLKSIRLVQVGEPLSRYVSKKVLPGFELAATSNLPISDERLEREFGKLSTDYFEMSEKNPELYEFLLAELLQDEGNLPLIDVSDLAPGYKKQNIPDVQRKTLKDGGIVMATDELIRDQTDVKHGFLYRLAYAIRAVQDSYIHGSKFNEKHLANTAFYEDFDSSGKVIIKGYIPDLKFQGATSATGGEMLLLTSGSSTLTPKTISRWIEGFASHGEKDFPRWIQRMLNDHIDQTSYEDGERIRAIFDYFHLFEQAPGHKVAHPLTPKEIGYLSPRVPRPVYVEHPKQEPVAVIDKEPQKEVTQLITEQVVLEDGTRVWMKVTDARVGDGTDANIVNLGKKIRSHGKDFVLVGLVEDKTSQHNGNFLGKPASGEELYHVFTAEELERGVFSYEAEKLLSFIGEKIPKMARLVWEKKCVRNKDNNPSKVSAPQW